MSAKTNEPTANERPLPVASFLYQTDEEENLVYKLRTVRVVELNDTHLRGFEIKNQYDDEPGKFKSFLRRKISGSIALLHLALAE